MVVSCTVVGVEKGEEERRVFGIESMEPAMEETGKGLSVPGGLSWRSRDTSWWTSAVDLSSTLISKMDQVGELSRQGSTHFVISGHGEQAASISVQHAAPHFGLISARVSLILM